jgi:hypothetical protein
VGSNPTPAARSPAWSPDSRKIGFAFRDQGIYLINRDGSGLKHISDTGDTPAWSPGGKRVAFSAYPTETSGSVIYAVRPDGSGKQVVAEPKNDVDSYLAPVWSPDGQLLAFAVETAPDSTQQPGRLGVIRQYNGRVRLFLRGQNARPIAGIGRRSPLLTTRSLAMASGHTVSGSSTCERRSSRSCATGRTRLGHRTVAVSLSASAAASGASTPTAPALANSRKAKARQSGVRRKGCGGCSERL